MTAFTLVTPPAVEPVTVAEMKAHARIDTDDDDALVAGLIVAARQWTENYTARALITQGWQVALDGHGADGCRWDGERQGSVTEFGMPRAIALPRAPLIAVDSVQIYDNADIAAVWDAGNYFVDVMREPGRLALRLGAVWPAPLRLNNGIVINYRAGYGDGADAVPDVLRLAIKQLAAHWYEHRGEAVVVASRGTGSHLAAATVPLVIQALLDPYRVRQLRV